MYAVSRIFRQMCFPAGDSLNIHYPRLVTRRFLLLVLIKQGWLERKKVMISLRTRVHTDYETEARGRVSSTRLSSETQLSKAPRFFARGVFSFRRIYDGKIYERTTEWECRTIIILHSFFAFFTSAILIIAHLEANANELLALELTNTPSRIRRVRHCLLYPRKVILSQL